MQIPNDPDWPEWERIIYHEAGHAALSMKLWDQPAPIVVIKSSDKDGNPSKGGSFKVQIKLEMSSKDLPIKTAVQNVMVCAAGYVTELIKFGNASNGFRKDKFQIDGIISVTNDQVARDEGDTNYPRTHQEVTQCAHAIEAIAKEAMKSFIDKELLGKDFAEVELLNGDSVASIYRSVTKGS
jgi:hypothetical protein